MVVDKLCFVHMLNWRDGIFANMVLSNVVNDTKPQPQQVVHDLASFPEVLTSGLVRRTMHG